MRAKPPRSGLLNATQMILIFARKALCTPGYVQDNTGRLVRLGGISEDSNDTNAIYVSASRTCQAFARLPRSLNALRVGVGGPIDCQSGFVIVDLGKGSFVTCYQLQ
jgi:hypothetical protein